MGCFRLINMRENKLIYISFILGLILWFGYCSDYSLYGNILDLIFPIIVGVIGFKAFKIIKADKECTKKQYVARILLVYPALFEGGIYIVLLILFILLSLFVPFIIIMGFGFAVSEIAQEELVQSEISPSGFTIADAYFRPVGAYASGNGRILV
jgi:hypothetical protein